MNLSRFAFLTLATFAVPAFAQDTASAKKIDSKKISKLVDQVQALLGNQIHSLTEKKVKGETAEEMLLNYAWDDETVVLNYPQGDDLPASDQDSRVGLLRLKDAVDLAMANPFEYGEPTRAQIEITEIELTKLFVELKNAGALLGYTTAGSAVCGVYFPSMLILDKNSGKIYEIVAVGGEC